MTESTLWWVLAGAMVAVELLTGTFYLLMLAIGMAAGAIAAHAGMPLSLQLVVASVVGGGAVVAWRSYKQKTPSAPPANANHDVNMDVGETVQVKAWAADGTSTVKYRGASWKVLLAAGETPSPGPHAIVEIQGSRLIVKKL